MGYTGFRYDMVKGYAPKYTKLYNEDAQPAFSVGEYWDGSASEVESWIYNTGKTSAAFDFPMKYLIKSAFGGDWSKLSNYASSSVAGNSSWAQYAVTLRRQPRHRRTGFQRRPTARQRSGSQRFHPRHAGHTMRVDIALEEV